MKRILYYFGTSSRNFESNAIGDDSSKGDIIIAYFRLQLRFTICSVEILSNVSGGCVKMS